MKNILFLDLETSGLDADRHGIMQISARLYTDGIEQSNSGFNCYLEIPESKELDLGALKVNKLLNNTQYKNCKVSYKTGISDFLKYLLDLPKDFILAGQNIQFDLHFLKTALKENNITNIEALIGRDYVDTKIIAKFLVEAGKITTKSTSLKYLAEVFNYPTATANFHDSLEDTKITAFIYFKMLDLLK